MSTDIGRTQKIGHILTRKENQESDPEMNQMCQLTDNNFEAAMICILINKDMFSVNEK